MEPNDVAVEDAVEDFGPVLKRPINVRTWEWRMKREANICIYVEFFEVVWGHEQVSIMNPNHFLFLLYLD